MFIFVTMVQGKLLIESDEGQEYRILYFNENDVNGIYVVDSDNMGVIINGNEYILEFDSSIFEAVKNVLKLKSLGFN